ncbi:MAG TPA: ABC transporter substrate-binding protein [Casimicrobiaceae bacterium]|nr:ABC transporter substrate-binding protein [Casimicrobiaceae bacterium]
MRTLSRSIGSLAIAAVALAGTTGVLAQDKVTFNMSWLPQGSVIGVVVAVDKGYFKEAGLDVNIVRGYGGNRTANELDQGQFEIGYVDPISLVLNRSNGGKIRLVGAINTTWPGGICYVNKAGKERSLDDLKGLALGGGSASPVHNVVPAWLEANGKPKDYIRLLRMDPAVVDASLIEGKIDLAECWRASNRAVIQKQAATAGVPIAWMEYSAYGLNAYGSGFATTEDIIQKRPDLVRKFLRAAYRGYEFSIANPDAAADIMVKMYPTVDRAVALQQIREINDLVRDASAADRALGYLREDRIRSTVDFVDKAFALNGKVKPADIYTNDLLK